MLPDNSLANTELVIYLSCKAGQGGLDANNLVTQTAAKGARTVIGFDRATNQFAIDEWYREFFKVYETAAESNINYQEICNRVYNNLVNNYPKLPLAVFETPTIAGELTLP